MALNSTRVQQIAKAYQDLANLFAAFEAKKVMLMKQNSNLSIPWGDVEDLQAIDASLVDAQGNIQGYNFSPAQLSNLIGSVAVLDASQGYIETHLQNYLSVADPR